VGGGVEWGGGGGVVRRGGGGMSGWVGFGVGLGWGIFGEGGLGGVVRGAVGGE